MPDGSTTVVDEEKDWREVKGWYKANPDIEERPTLQYPVEITFQDGATQIINNDEDMVSAKENCRD